MRELFAEHKEKVYENLWKFNAVKKVPPNAREQTHAAEVYKIVFLSLKNNPSPQIISTKLQLDS